MNNEFQLLETKITVNNDGATIQIPSNLLKYLKINKKTSKLFLVPTNNTIQISNEKPLSAIPLLTKKDVNIFEPIKPLLNEEMDINAKNEAF